MLIYIYYTIVVRLLSQRFVIEVRSHSWLWIKKSSHSVQVDITRQLFQLEVMKTLLVVSVTGLVKPLTVSDDFGCVSWCGNSGLWVLELGLHICSYLDFSIGYHWHSFENITTIMLISHVMGLFHRNSVIRYKIFSLKSVTLQKKTLLHLNSITITV